jgi:hypothetical protein
MERIISKVCEECNKEFYLVYRKRKQRFCCKRCAHRSLSVINKMKENQLKTYRKKYGVDHPMKTKEVVNNFKKSMLNKYGVEHALLSDELLKRSENTKFRRYGDKKYTNIKKRKETCIRKYGVDNPMKCGDIIKKVRSGIDYKNYLLIKEYCNKNGIILLNDYNNGEYRFRCNKCNKEFGINNSSSKVYKLRSIYCEECYNNKNIIEEVYKYILDNIPQGELVNKKDKSILLNKELDIYIPSLKLAIDISKLSSSSEIKGGINKNYYINKYKSCLFHGIRLIHIFETEWREKSNIIKSILNNLLKCNNNTKVVYINGRECEVKEVNKIKSDEFLNNNHLQGRDKSKIKLGLYYNNELVSIMTFGKSRFDKRYEYEMIRYCNRINTKIRGGASKLFKYFIRVYKPKSVISYADKRYFDGKIYLVLGFNFLSNTGPNFYYIGDNYKVLYNRIIFQKYKLKNILNKYNSKLTEWENMKNNGYDKIWDCGCSKWIWKSNLL